MKGFTLFSFALFKRLLRRFASNHIPSGSLHQANRAARFQTTNQFERKAKRQSERDTDRGERVAKCQHNFTDSITDQSANQRKIDAAPAQP